MRFLNRHFFAGVVVGVVLTVGLIVGGFALYVRWIMHGPPQRYAAYLETPTFPRADTLASYGTPDPSFHLTALGGARTTLGEFRGRTVFFNAWATWCLPCVAEMPSIEALSASIDDSSVVFVLASGEDAGRVKKFAEEKGVDLPFYVYEGPLPEPLRPKSIPATYIIDGDGSIVYRHVGAANWNDRGTRAFLARLGSPD